MENIETADIRKKQAFIFDVDGTLYSQKKMRGYIFVKIVMYYAFHFGKIKELFSVYVFRRLREMDVYRQTSINDLQKLTAEKLRIKEECVKNSIKYWMFELPLERISEFSFKEVLIFIKEMRREGKKIYIYSDYPAEEKVEKLGLDCERIFTPELSGIGGQKPNKQAMEFIVSEIHLPPEQILYVGDRYEKDGLSACLAGIDYCNIRRLQKLLAQRYL